MGTGGRRYGAGRPGWKPKTTALHHLDVRRLEQEDCLKPGAAYRWAWKNNAGEVIGSVGLSVSSNGLAISYTTNGSDVAVFARIERTRCNYGGARPWFACPNCRRRVAILYLGNQVACRRCFLMAYPSQSEDEADRLRRRQRKIEAQLNDGRRKTEKTRARLLAEIARIELQRTRALTAMLSRMFGPEEFSTLDLQWNR